MVRFDITPFMLKLEESEKFSRPDITSPTRIVRVQGSSGKEFFVHKNLLFQYSPYFSKDVKEETASDQLELVKLEDFNEPEIELLVQWFYTQKIPLTICKDAMDPEQQSKDKPNFRDLISLWKVARHLSIPRLQNEVIRVLHEKTARLNVVPLGLAELVCTTTTADSMLQKYILHQITKSTFNDSVWDNGYQSSLSPTTVFKLMRRFKQELDLIRKA